MNLKTLRSKTGTRQASLGKVIAAALDRKAPKCGANYFGAQKPGMPNQALEQTRDSVLRYGAVVGCELLNFFVRQYKKPRARARAVLA
jgi:hypothetical protein